LRKLTRVTLTEFGYTVIEAMDGEEAITKFIENKDRIDLILLDLIMPKKNGREVYEEIKVLKQGLKVIYISGYPADITRERVDIDKGIDFVMKPISPTKLLKRIRELLDK
jgi:DNA-binding response OmpR family regulator